MSKLALLGGEKSVTDMYDALIKWPIINDEMRQAVVKLLDDGNMSGTDINKKFEEGFAKWHGVKYALSHCNGTASLHAAMYGAGVGVGDEIICPTMTYWASCLQATNLGASVVFVDVEPDSLCLDPDDFERKITSSTKAVVVVHYLSHPANMDRILPIAKKHNIKVIEDCSHCHGAKYKGKITGTFGDVAGFSCMSGKSFAIGEGGMMITDDRDIYERAILFGQCARHGEIQNEKLKKQALLPWGGFKYRMHQMSSAVGLLQLKKYPQEIAEIDKVYKYFWKQLEGVKGIRAHVPKDEGSTKGGWYLPYAHYIKEELGGLSSDRFCEALNAEGCECGVGCNTGLHSHPLFNTVDVYGHGRPTNSANLPTSMQKLPEAQDFPVSNSLQAKLIGMPYFKHFDKKVIDQHIAAIKKVCENYSELLSGNTKAPMNRDRWFLTKRK